MSPSLKDVKAHALFLKGDLWHCLEVEEVHCLEVLVVLAGQEHEHLVELEEAGRLHDP
jgi:hypothetical protein